MADALAIREEAVAGLSRGGVGVAEERGTTSAQASTTAATRWELGLDGLPVRRR
jgi:hypothetical protein